MIAEQVTPEFKEIIDELKERCSWLAAAAIDCANNREFENSCPKSRGPMCKLYLLAQILGVLPSDVRNTYDLAKRAEIDRFEELNPFNADEEGNFNRIAMRTKKLGSEEFHYGIKYSMIGPSHDKELKNRMATLNSSDIKVVRKIGPLVALDHGTSPDSKLARTEILKMLFLIMPKTWEKQSTVRDTVKLAINNRIIPCAFTYITKRTVDFEVFEEYTKRSYFEGVYNAQLQARMLAVNPTDTVKRLKDTTELERFLGDKQEMKDMAEKKMFNNVSRINILFLFNMFLLGFDMVQIGEIELVYSYLDKHTYALELTVDEFQKDAVSTFAAIIDQIEETDDANSDGNPVLTDSGDDSDSDDEVVNQDYLQAFKGDRRNTNTKSKEAKAETKANRKKRKDAKTTERQAEIDAKSEEQDESKPMEKQQVTRSEKKKKYIDIYSMFTSGLMVTYEKSKQFLETTRLSCQGSLVEIKVDPKMSSRDLITKDAEFYNLMKPVNSVIIDLPNVLTAMKWSLADVKDFADLMALYGIPCVSAGTKNREELVNIMSITPTGRGHDDLITLEQSFLAGSFILSSDRYSEFNNVIVYCDKHGYISIRKNQHCEFDSSCVLRVAGNTPGNRLNIVNIIRNSANEMAKITVGLPLVTKWGETYKKNKVYNIPKAIINEISDFNLTNGREGVMLSLPGLTPIMAAKVTTHGKYTPCTTVVFGINGMAIEIARARPAHAICAAIDEIMENEDKAEELSSVIKHKLVRGNNGGLVIVHENNEYPLDESSRDYRPIIFNKEVEVTNKRFRMRTNITGGHSIKGLKMKLNNQTANLDLTDYTLHTTDKMVAREMAVMISSKSTIIIKVDVNLLDTLCSGITRELLASKEPAMAYIAANTPNVKERYRLYDLKKMAGFLMNAGQHGTGFESTYMGTEFLATSGIKRRQADKPTLLLDNTHACMALDIAAQFWVTEEKPKHTMTGLRVEFSCVIDVNKVEIYPAGASSLRKVFANTTERADVSVGAAQEDGKLYADGASMEEARHWVKCLLGVMSRLKTRLLSNMASCMTDCSNYKSEISMPELVFSVELTEFVKSAQQGSYSIRWRTPFSHVETALFVAGERVFFIGLVLPSPPIGISIASAILGYESDYNSEWNDTITGPCDIWGFMQAMTITETLSKIITKQRIREDVVPTEEEVQNDYMCLVYLLVGVLGPGLTMLGFDVERSIITIVAKITGEIDSLPVELIVRQPFPLVVSTVKELYQAVREGETCVYRPKSTNYAWHDLIKMIVTTPSVVEADIMELSKLFPEYMSLEKFRSHVSYCFGYPHARNMTGAALFHTIKANADNRFGKYRQCKLTYQYLPILMNYSVRIQEKEDRVIVHTDSHKAEIVERNNIVSTIITSRLDPHFKTTISIPPLRTQIDVAIIRKNKEKMTRNLDILQVSATTYEVRKTKEYIVKHGDKSDMRAALTEICNNDVNVLLFGYDKLGPDVKNMGLEPVYCEKNPYLIHIPDELLYNTLKHIIVSTTYRTETANNMVEQAADDIGKEKHDKDKQHMTTETLEKDVKSDVKSKNIETIMANAFEELQRMLTSNLTSTLMVFGFVLGALLLPVAVGAVTSVPRVLLTMLFGKRSRTFFGSVSKPVLTGMWAFVAQLLSVVWLGGLGFAAYMLWNKSTL